MIFLKNNIKSRPYYVILSSYTICSKVITGGRFGFEFIWVRLIPFLILLEVISSLFAGKRFRTLRIFFFFINIECKNENVNDFLCSRPMEKITFVFIRRIRSVANTRNARLLISIWKKIWTTVRYSSRFGYFTDLNFGKTILNESSIKFSNLITARYYNIT